MLLALWYSKLSYTSRVNPKSDILTRLSSQTKMLRAARSRCTNFFCDKYSCTMKQYGLNSLKEKRLFSSSFPFFVFTLSLQIIYFWFVFNADTKVSRYHANSYLSSKRDQLILTQFSSVVFFNVLFGLGTVTDVSCQVKTEWC